MGEGVGADSESGGDRSGPPGTDPGPPETDGGPDPGCFGLGGMGTMDKARCLLWTSETGFWKYRQPGLAGSKERW